MIADLRADSAAWRREQRMVAAAESSKPGSPSTDAAGSIVRDPYDVGASSYFTPGYPRLDAGESLVRDPYDFRYSSDFTPGYRFGFPHPGHTRPCNYYVPVPTPEVVNPAVSSAPIRPTLSTEMDSIASMTHDEYQRTTGAPQRLQDAPQKATAAVATVNAELGQPEQQMPVPHTNDNNEPAVFDNMPSPGHSQIIESGRAVRFATVSQPDDLRNEEEMQKNRTHVMLNYLERERLKPETGSASSDAAVQSKRRARPDAREAVSEHDQDNDDSMCHFGPESLPHDSGYSSGNQIRQQLDLEEGGASDDAASIVTDLESVGIPEGVKTDLIALLSDDLLDNLDPATKGKLRDHEVLQAVASSLPQLLKAYSCMMKCKATNRVEAKAAVFVRHEWESVQYLSRLDACLKTLTWNQ
jgi:hypothetical protein